MVGRAQSLGDLLALIAAENAESQIGARPLPAAGSGASETERGVGAQPMRGTQCRDAATWVAPTEWSFYPGLYATQRASAGSGGGGRAGTLDRAGSRRLTFILPSPRECALRFTPLVAPLAAAGVQARLAAYNPAIARLPPDAPLSGA